MKHLIAAAGWLVLAGAVAADKYDAIAARALAEAIHQRREPSSVFVPDNATRRRPTVVDSYDLGEQPAADPSADGNRRVVKAEKPPAKKPAKKAAPKRTVRRVISEPAYYAPPLQWAPQPVFGGGFGGGGFGGGFSGGACGPGG